jgi:hypothetical protein
MALHPGSLSIAYDALREHGFAASTMRHACEVAADRGTYTIGRATITFDREAGYRVTTRPLPPLAATLAELRAGDVVTELVKAPSTEAASEIIAQVRERDVLMALADLLFVDPEGHGLPWVRKRIVAEARA